MGATFNVLSPDGSFGEPEASGALIAVCCAIPGFMDALGASCTNDAHSVNLSFLNSRFPDWG